MTTDHQQEVIQLLKQIVEWGELDYLLIDLPPGTGDAQITIIQESPICGVILVTTPQQVAVADVHGLQSILMRTDAIACPMSPGLKIPTVLICMESLIIYHSAFG